MLGLCMLLWISTGVYTCICMYIIVRSLYNYVHYNIHVHFSKNIYYCENVTTLTMIFIL